MMLTTESVLDSANRLRPLLLQLNRHLRRELGPLGITGGQAALLHTIRRHPGIGVSELAAMERISRPGMSGYVDRLEASGLVRRVRSQHDRRRVGLEVTAAGVRMLRSARTRRTAWLARRMRQLSVEQLAALEQAIEPLEALLAADGVGG
jgi:DNA-binding MarR family transcriptional regulator